MIMRTMYLALIMFLFAGFSLEAQEIKPKEPIKPKPEDKEMVSSAAENPNAPDISFEKTEHDYGKIMQHGDGNCEFKFTNTGKEPLILSNVRSSCGCTVPQWPKQPILPGESESIKVKYDTKRVGVINKSITVTSNAKTATVVLKIKGTVLAQADQPLPQNNVDESGAPVNK